MKNKDMPVCRVLFVCTGNICRSPTAEGVFRRYVEDAWLDAAIQIDSAGTHGYHIGDPPDRRTVETARARGYDLSQLRARRLEATDYDEYDYIVAMDDGHLDIMQRQSGAQRRAKLSLFLSDNRSVPDPYYGTARDFEHVLDLVEEGAARLLAQIRWDKNL